MRESHNPSHMGGLRAQILIYSEETIKRNGQATSSHKLSASSSRYLIGTFE